MDGMSLLNAMAQKMRWQQQRQDVLAQNVANADTPNYRGQELKPVDFDDELSSVTRVAMVSTNPMHISASETDTDGPAEVVQQAEL